jgi:hypothetical protein
MYISIRIPMSILNASVGTEGGLQGREELGMSKEVYGWERGQGCEDASVHKSHKKIYVTNS